LLRGTGSAATVALAGCGSFGGDGGDGSDEGDGGGNAEASRDPVDDRVEVDPADIQEGGTFRTAVGENPDTFDFPFSSSASASALHNLMYEGMTTSRT
jgi:hypothetical protein